MSDLPPELFQHWVRSREDESGETRVYRPANYPFPPARGRESIELTQDGRFISHGIAPADGTSERTGRWRSLGGNRIRIEYGAGPAKPESPKSEVWRIESCEKGVLKIRR